MRETLALQLHDPPASDWGMLCPVSAPAFSGTDEDGIDWACPECQTVLIEGAVNGRQFLDLLFRCYACGAVARSALRTPGQPLAGLAVLVPPGQYMLGSPVEMTNEPPVMCVGHQAIDGYLREIGNKVAATDSEEGDSTERDLTPLGLRAMASEAADLLGERYTDLVAADERGRNSSTPPIRRHRLIELIIYAREAAEAIEGQRGQSVTLDANKLSELVTTMELLDRWRNHPAWPDLVTTLAGKTEGQHTVMMLGVASYLADAGNGVGLAVDNGVGGRIPDIWCEPTLLERLDIEVKTPQDLRGPRATPLTVDEATKIISRQLKKAAATTGGQLDVMHSGILAIGGFHLGPGSLDTLEIAAAAVLSRQVGHKAHLAAVTVSELSYALTEVVDDHGNQVQAHLQPGFETRLIRHSGYRGDLEIHDGPRPPITFTPQLEQDAGGPSRAMPDKPVPLNRAERRRAQREAKRQRRHL